MEIKLLKRNSIAGAVAREIHRREFAPVKQIEGMAYKAAFDRMGSAAEKHIDCYARDVLINSIAHKYHICPKCKTRVKQRELIDGETCPRCFTVI